MSQWKEQVAVWYVPVRDLVVYITSFQGYLLEYDGGGGTNWRKGALI